MTGDVPQELLGSLPLPEEARPQVVAAPGMMGRPPRVRVRGLADEPVELALAWPDPVHERLDVICMYFAIRRLEVFTGTPSASPQLPLVPSGAVPLVVLRVPPNAAAVVLEDPAPRGADG